MDGNPQSLISKSGDRYGFTTYVQVNPTTKHAKVTTSVPPGTGTNAPVAGYFVDTNWALGDWVQVGIVLGGTGTYLYINGAPVIFDSRPAFFDSINQRDLYMGIFQVDGNCHPLWYPLTGMLDEVRFYNRSLSTDEIGRLYQSEAANLP